MVGRQKEKEDQAELIEGKIQELKTYSFLRKLGNRSCDAQSMIVQKELELLEEELRQFQTEQGLSARAKI